MIALPFPLTRPTQKSELHAARGWRWRAGAAFATVAAARRLAADAVNGAPLRAQELAILFDRKGEPRPR